MMNDRLQLSALLAIVYAAGLAGFETLVNWGQWQWWPWWLVDYVAAAMLASGGFATRRKAGFGRALLSAGWGFALGMMWMSLAGNVSEGADPDRSARVAGFYIGLIAFSMGYCLLGLWLSLSHERPQTGR